MSADLIVSKNELQIVLNRFSNKIEVDYPLTSQQIFTAEPEEKHYEIELYITPDDFEDYSNSELWE